MGITMAETTTKTEVTVPHRLKNRPRYGGYIVPYFVAWFKDGHLCNERTKGAKPHFPATDQRRLVSCRQQNRCWICGSPLGTHKAFVFGPASALARASYEPPSHRDCARYAMQVCPYLTNPNAKHAVDKGYELPEDTTLLPDVSPHHPGVTLIYVTRQYGVEQRDPSRGVVVFLPDAPTQCEFWTEGRRASYKEACDAIQRAILDNRMLEMSDEKKKREIAWRVQELLKGAVHAMGDP